MINYVAGYVVIQHVVKHAAQSTINDRYSTNCGTYYQFTNQIHILVDIIIGLFDT